ncbi:MULTISPECIES: hypothetical protein [unclassified Mesorhizobium]|uniref:hypothetical protein n=1 Tax=unclassified Mesorhizobium TaxID=325217 RepID=UPI000FD23952|nr:MULTISPECIES: hypothetical protein [unclassified Mesorhizobium]RVB72391.1 hypothetical protein EN885_29200 [Mesorhizobium sp. M6A.T.Cr.TU.014.01.1.1]RWP98837.1 MAG: hypothetical protein EOR91_27500 [Mesorhizobium sp.]RWQ01196.1 MAG: hypothetical protein EOR90_21320 [Mesorhizobium sp.]
MLKRVWDGTVSLWATIAICSFLLFVTALGFLSTRAYDRATKDYQTSRAYDETRRQLEQRCAGLEGKEIFDCLKEQIETAREPSRSEEDVSAQKEMARWALWMLVVSGVVGFATLGITAIGLYYIRDTLAVTRRAMLDTRSIGQAQVRAYLSCTGGDFGIEKNWFTCRVHLVNKGQSPAFYVFLKAAVSTMIRDHSEPEDEFPSWKRVDGKMSEGIGGMIQAGGDATIFVVWEHESIGTDAHDILAKTKSGFNIDCVVEWRDVFNEPQKASFSLHEGQRELAPHFQEEFSRSGVLTAYNRGPHGR